MKKLLSFAFALMATNLIPLAAQATKVLTVYFSYSGNTKIGVGTNTQKHLARIFSR
ncbi:MAG: hypothetical protein LE180_06570 [Endomicrobium sp.]|uniref:hypothetical protein n=1 Tax=Candidatus Endomicrobiellum pyrsonymphae TaxID=1408203 RepID=UPI0035891EEB|nr:hypothetical protein [Endomicrobium sp.]